MELALGPDRVWDLIEKEKATRVVVSWGSLGKTVDLTTGPQILKSIKILLEYRHT